ncbi:MAG: cadmium-translocating P-type ATPase [Clostridia bacterium]|nr:cadmium-translocating P-type ATPase [Clostridia bacterium]
MKEHREELIKISITTFLLVLLITLQQTKILSLPFWGWLLLYLIPYLLIGWEVLREAAEKILHLDALDESFLMTVATIGALILGEYAEAVFVLLFFSVGELFEDIGADRSRKSISALMDLRPDRVSIERDGTLVTVSPEEAKIGEIMVISAGDRLPLDGVITEGSSALDTSALTGESLPASVQVGDAVAAGCINLSGALKVRITSSAAESTVAKILKLVEESAETKAKSETFIRRFAKVYTPIVVLLAVLLAILPSVLFGNPQKWITEALSLLVISCPCALVVSVPLAYFNGIGMASRRGILVKGAATVEELARLKTIVFDKTGTLTHGNFSVTVIHPNEVTETELLSLAALAESYSNHPISLSLKNACHSPLDRSRLGTAHEFSGEGISVEIDGKTVLVGNEKLMQRFSVDCTNDCDHSGTVLHVAIAQQYVGHIVIADEIKPSTPEAVQALRQSGIQTVMLTGDRLSVAKDVAEKVGIANFSAELLPADKVNKLEELMQIPANRPCAFVGDGINDAPVLLRADVGISMGTLGSDAAIEASDMILLNDNLQKIPLAIRLAQKTCRIVRQNIAFSLTVKFAVLLLALFGFSNLWIASFADVGVLVLAVLNSVRK